MSNEEMKSKLDGFKKTYSDFMMGNIDDEELAKDTTQPFWQSMYLSKKRLESNDIEEERVSLNSLLLYMSYVKNWLKI